MASTETLMDLIEEFPGAFEEPEQEQVKPVATEESSNDEPMEENLGLPKSSLDIPMPEVKPAKVDLRLPANWVERLESSISSHADTLLYNRSAITARALDMKECLTHLVFLADKPAHLMYAEVCLKDIVEAATKDYASMNKPVNETDEDLALDLPETYARETSKDCPSGMCPIDH